MRLGGELLPTVRGFGKFSQSRLFTALLELLDSREGVARSHLVQLGGSGHGRGEGSLKEGKFPIVGLEDVVNFDTVALENGGQVHLHERDAKREQNVAALVEETIENAEGGLQRNVTHKETQEPCSRDGRQRQPSLFKVLENFGKLVCQEFYRVRIGGK